MKHFRSLLTAIVFCLVTSASWAQADLNNLDQYFEEARAKWDVPGMAVAIVKDGKIVHVGGYGVRELGGRELVDQNTLFAIASNTKAFVAASLASLVDEGKLTWDDPIQKHLPYFQLVDEVATKRATVKDALSHAVGLGTYSGDVVWYNSDHTPEEVLRLIAHLEPAFEFRNGYGYSNVMFIAAGEVIGAVSGMPWDQFIQQHFFKPLGMNRSLTAAAGIITLGNYATPHKISEGQNVALKWTDWTAMGSGAAAGIVSSANDMAQWLKLHLNEGRIGDNVLFSERSQQQMWHPEFNYMVTPQTRETYPGRTFNAYGLAWGVSEYQGQLMVAHGGAYDGMYSRVAMVPELELGVVVLTNSMKNMGPWLVYDIVDAYLEHSVRGWSEFGRQADMSDKKAFAERMADFRNARIESTTPRFPMSQIVGTYHDDLYGDIEVQNQNGVLRLIFPRATRLNATLEHFHFDTYEINWDETHSWFDFGTIQFESNHKNEVIGLTFSVPNEDIFFEEIHPVKVK